MTEVRVNRIDLGKPGPSQKGNHASPVLTAWQIVDAETGHSMGAGLWASKDMAVECCKRKRWRITAEEAAA
jgi:hypothetical protein